MPGLLATYKTYRTMNNLIPNLVSSFEPILRQTLFLLSFLLLLGLPGHVSTALAQGNSNNPPSTIVVDGAPDEEPDGLFIASVPQKDRRLSAPDVLQSRHVQIAFDQLGPEAAPSLDGTSQLKLNLFEDVVYTAVLDRIEWNDGARYGSTSADSYTWIGHLLEEPESLVVMVVRGESLYGTISTTNGNYSIQRLHDGNGLHAIVQNDPLFYARQNGTDARPAFDDPATQQLLGKPAIKSRTARQGTETSFRYPADNGDEVDVLVAYSDDFLDLNYVGSTEGAISLVELYIAYTNAVLSRTEADLQINLVHLQEIEYDEWTADEVDEDVNYLGKDLDDLYQGERGLDVVHELRDTYHADQVTMLFGNGGGGLAYVTNFDPNTQWLGFAAVGCWSSCDYIYAHEVGHNLGATHDWYSSGMGGTVRSYGHGHSDVENRFRTVMAYGEICIVSGEGCPVAPYFSNPDLTYNGGPLGIAGGTNESCERKDTDNYMCDADNRRMFNETSPIIAGYRSSEVVWTGAANDAWKNPANWEMIEGALNATNRSTEVVNRVPRSMDDVLIPSEPSGGRFPRLSSSAEARNLLIAENATLDISSGTLSIYGHWEDHGTVTISGGTVNFKANKAQTLRSNPASNFQHLKLGDNTSQEVSLLSDLTVDGDLTFASGALLRAGSYTMTVNGDWTEESNNFFYDTSTVILNGTNQAITKAPSAVLLDERFATYDNIGGISFNSGPSGWKVTNDGDGTPWRFTATDWAPNGSLEENGHARRWHTSDGSEIDTWLFTPEFEFYSDYEYALTFEYGSSDPGCTTEELHVKYGASQDATDMNHLLQSYTLITNTTWLTTTPALSFQVAEDGTYTIGFNNKNSNGDLPCGISLDNVKLIVSSPHLFYNLKIQSDGNQGAHTNTNLWAKNELQIEAGSLLDVGSNEIFVDNSVINQGALQQTRRLALGDGDATYDFLTIMDGDETTTQYYGVQITPEAGELGETSVRIQGQQDCSVESDDLLLIDRCFTVTADSPASEQDSPSATIRYWYTEKERNRQFANDIKALSLDDEGQWVAVGDSSAYGETGRACASDASCWFEWRGIQQFGTMAGGAAYSDLTLKKSVSTANLQPGQPITYTLTFTNIGPSLAVDVQLIDLLPPEGFLAQNMMSNVATDGVPITNSSGALVEYSWAITNFAPGESGSTTLAGIIDPTLTDNAQITNRGTVEAINDFLTATNSAAISVSISVPSLAFENSAYSISEDAMTATQTLATFTVTVTPVNPYSPITFTYQTVEGTASADADYVSTTETLVIPAGSGLITFTLPVIDDLVLEPNETMTMTLIDPLGARLGLAEASLVIIEDDFIDIAIGKRVRPVEAIPGEIITYTLSISNLSNIVALGSVLTDVVPTGLVDLAVQSTVPLVATEGITYAWTVGDLAPSTENIVTIRGRLAPLVGGTELTNLAAITHTNDRTASNNESDAVPFLVLNGPPVTEVQELVINEDQVIFITPLLDDSDPNGDQIFLQNLGTAENGDLSTPATDIATMTVAYTPTLNYNGTDMFTYTVRDDAPTGPLSTLGRVQLVILAVNDPPTLADDTTTVVEDEFITVSSLENDFDVESDAFAISRVGDPANGTATTDGTTIYYTPTANFSGIDYFTYEVTEESGRDPLSSTAVVTVNVTGVNDPPLAVSDGITIDEDSLVTLTVLLNDIDVDLDPMLNTEVDLLTVIDLGIPTLGVVTTDGTTLSYLPNTDVHGVDIFTYTIADQGGITSTATVTLTILAVNDAPIAAQDSITTSEDVGLTIPVLENDSDVEGDELSLLTVGQPLSGTVDIQDQTLFYTPDPDINGQDSFTYTIGDSAGLTATGTVLLVIEPVDDPPLANRDVVTTSEEILISISVLDNDSHVDGDPFSVIAVSEPLTGMVGFSEATLVYVPPQDFNGLERFFYTIEDSDGLTATGVVEVNVLPVNDPPIAEDDIIILDEDSVEIVQVLNNDRDVDGDSLRVLSFTEPASGTLEIEGAEVFYRAAPDFNGTESIDYVIGEVAPQGDITGTILLTATARVIFQVQPVNDAPAATDDVITTTEDIAMAVHVLSNDLDVDNDLLTIESIGSPKLGDVTIEGNSLLYTPQRDLFGTDTFTYTIVDPDAAQSQATVTVHIVPVVDRPIAVEDSIRVAEDSTISIPVLENDLDTDVAAGESSTLSIESFTAPTNGVAEIRDDLLIYTPAENFAGIDGLTYTIVDGDELTATTTVVITVTAINDQPVAEDDSVEILEDQILTIGVLENDSDVDGDALRISAVGLEDRVQISNTRLIYTPEPNVSGIETFTYTISDRARDDEDGLSAEATVTVTVRAVNDPPLAVVDEITTTEDVAILVDVLENDGDPDGSPLSIVAVGKPLHGYATIEENGVRYTPGADVDTLSTFTYTISDGTLTAFTIVLVEIVSVNDSPYFTIGPEDTVLPTLSVQQLPGSGPQLVSGWVTGISPGAENESGQALTFTVEAENPALFATQPAIDAATGDLTYALMPNVAGDSLINVVLVDDGGTENGGVDRSEIKQFTISASIPTPSPTATVPPTPSTMPSATLTPTQVISVTETPASIPLPQLPTVVPAIPPTVTPVPSPTPTITPTIVFFTVTEVPSATPTAEDTPVNTEPGRKPELVVPTDTPEGTPPATPTPTATALPSTNTPAPGQTPIDNNLPVITETPTLPFDPIILFGPGVTPTVVDNSESAEVNVSADVDKAMHAPNETTRYDITVQNQRVGPLEGSIVEVTIPSSTTFHRSDDNSDGVTAASALASGSGWELPDGSGPCPDEHPGGQICVFRVGALAVNEEWNEPFYVMPEADMAGEPTDDITIRFSAADRGQVQLIRLVAEVTSVGLEVSKRAGHRLYLPVIQQ